MHNDKSVIIRKVFEQTFELKFAVNLKLNEKTFQQNFSEITVESVAHAHWFRGYRNFRTCFTHTVTSIKLTFN